MLRWKRTIGAALLLSGLLAGPQLAQAGTGGHGRAAPTGFGFHGWGPRGYGWYGPRGYGWYGVGFCGVGFCAAGYYPYGYYYPGYYPVPVHMQW
jgi:hypothetical protein